jgi:hypothetical protein
MRFTRSKGFSNRLVNDLLPELLHKPIAVITAKGIDEDLEHEDRRFETDGIV